MKSDLFNAMKFLVLTLFPEMFAGPISQSIVQRAQEQGLVEIGLRNIREFGKGTYRQVDDTPYGGGAGMVLRVDVAAEALRAAKDELPEAKIIAFTPRGERLTQEKCSEYAAARTPLILLCGHFEGIDERIYEQFVDEEISLGDFVLTGGEIPALALIDGVTRLLPGVVGNEHSISEESFSAAFAGRCEYPQYTRPEEFEGEKVPEVLLSGHHAEIQRWRIQNLYGFSEQEKRIFDIRREYFSAQKPWKTRLLLLREHIAEDQAYWVAWMNDPEVTRFLRFDLPYLALDAAEYFAAKQLDCSGLFLTILERTSRESIGQLSLELDPEDPEKAKFGVYLGAKELWGQGYGTAATLEALRIGFELLGLRKIILEVFSENLPALKMYERCGFRLVGEMKQEVLKADGVHDLLLMEILRAEWEERGREEQVTRKFLDLRGDFAI